MCIRDSVNTALAILMTVCSVFIPRTRGFIMPSLIVAVDGIIFSVFLFYRPSAMFVWREICLFSGVIKLDANVYRASGKNWRSRSLGLHLSELFERYYLFTYCGKFDEIWSKCLSYQWKELNRFLNYGFKVMDTVSPGLWALLFQLLCV